jgi:hypothetical protein
MRSSLVALAATTICAVATSLTACSGGASAPSGDQGSEAAFLGAKTSVKRAKKLTNTALETVRAKLEDGAPSFPADGYEGRRLKYTGDAKDLIAALIRFNKHLKDVVEIPTASVASVDEAKRVVDDILRHLELNEIENAAKTALSDALLASVFVDGKAAVRVILAIDGDDASHDVFLVDSGRREILDMNEGS